MTLVKVKLYSIRAFIELYPLIDSIVFQRYSDFKQKKLKTVHSHASLTGSQINKTDSGTMHSFCSRASAHAFTRISIAVRVFGLMYQPVDFCAFIYCLNYVNNVLKMNHFFGGRWMIIPPFPV